MPLNHSLGADYMDVALEPNRLRDAIAIAQSKLAGWSFDAFLVRGYSGAIFAGALMAAMHKPVCVVRKETEVGHGGMVFGAPLEKRYLFIDDFICTGETFCAAVEKLLDYRKLTSNTKFGGFEIVGAYEYKNAVISDSEEINRNSGNARFILKKLKAFNDELNPNNAPSACIEPRREDTIPMRRVFIGPGIGELLGGYKVGQEVSIPIPVGPPSNLQPLRSGPGEGRTALTGGEE